MLVYAAIVPHPPFALPSIGGEHSKSFTATQKAFLRVAEDLKVLKVDTIVIISPHGERYKDAVALALHDPFIASVKEFGDMGLQASYKPDLQLIDRIQRTLNIEGVQKTLTTNENLDHASAISLLLFGDKASDLKVLTITPHQTDGKTLLKVGEIIRGVLENHTKRVAIISATNLSGRLSSLAEGGAHPQAEDYVNRIRNGISDGNKMSLINLQNEMSETMNFTDLDSLLLFFGILGDTRFRPEEYAYEAPLGTGHLTEAFHII